jgi:hypothetical protein
MNHEEFQENLLSLVAGAGIKSHGDAMSVWKALLAAKLTTHKMLLESQGIPDSTARSVIEGVMDIEAFLFDLVTPGVDSHEDLMFHGFSAWPSLLTFATSRGKLDADGLRQFISSWTGVLSTLAYLYYIQPKREGTDRDHMLATCSEMTKDIVDVINARVALDDKELGESN